MIFNFNVGNQSPPVNEEILQEVIGYLQGGALQNTGLSQNAIQLIIDGTYNEIQKFWNLIEKNRGN